MATTTPELIPRDETAAIVRLHPKTLIRFAREGRIGSVRSGNRTFFTLEHINDYLFGDAPTPEPKTAKPTRNPRYTR